jgi:hypothetical protein
MAEVTFYNRLEPRPRDNDFTYTLAAPVRDPLWFLTRQWQIGEFNGEDNGSVAFVQYGGRTSRMPRWLAPDGTEVSLSDGAPLEPQTLREPFAPDIGLQVELGNDFVDLLREEMDDDTATDDLVSAFHDTEQYELDEPADPSLNPVDSATRRFLGVCSGRVLNGYELYVLAKTVDGGGSVPGNITTDNDEIAAIERALGRLLSRVRDIYGELGTSDPSTWQPERLEYRLQVIGADPSGEGNAVLDAHPNSDGEFEWFSFDVASRNAAASEAAPDPVGFFTVPARVQFDGMPSTRFWNFEDSTLSLPDISAEGLDDLLKLLITDFMLVHSNDWYVLPYEQAVGTLAKTDFIVVYDVFGKLTLIERAEGALTAAGTDRWTMFSIADGDDLADYFVLPPSSGPAMQVGQVLEDVRFGRDETANMAFGIERITTSLIGEERSGRQRDGEIAARLDLPPKETTDNPYPLRYSVESEVPANWVPLFPIETTAPDIVLEVGATIKATASDTFGTVPPQSKILTPQGVGDDYQIQEEEIPRAGLKVERAVFRSRWIDGSNHLWVQRRRSIGAGEAQSGLAFDQPLPNES